MTENGSDPHSSDHSLADCAFIDVVRLADHSQDAIYHEDVGARRFRFTNRQFHTFFTNGAAESPIATLDQLILRVHPEDRSPLREAVDQSLRDEAQEGEAEYRVPHGDGSIRWLHDRWIVSRDAAGRPVARQGFIRDHTREKLSELQFIGSRQNALIGSYIVQDGRFKYVNPQFVAITGHTPTELIGTDSLALVHEDYREHVRHCAVKMLAGKDATPYEFCVRDKAGATHWVMETVTSVIYRQRRAVLGYFMDVTKLHEMRDNLSNLGLMLGTIAHSLRGCLTGLNAGLYNVETGFYRNNQAQIEEGLDLSKLMSDRVRKLVADILYYAKERDLEIETVAVWRFARDVATLIETRIKAANIAFVTHIAQDAGWMAIDPEIIRTALMNILENAMEACIADVRPIAHQITFTTTHDEANVYFAISDNGPGIDQEQAERIFQLFSSSKGKRGTGIGLFVTRKAILKHGGTIDVDSSPNRGAAFLITLPRRPLGHDADHAAT